MNVQEAALLLEVSDCSDSRQIKEQYRKKMRQHHPDVSAAGTGASSDMLQLAQTINEAYELLKKESIRLIQKKKSNFWKSEQNFQAYCERDVFLSGADWSGHEEDKYLIAHGKYYWDPLQEDFEMFLYSLKQMVDGLIGSEDDGRGNKIRQKLFFLLGIQFVDGVSCLRKLYAPYKVDGQNREIYRLKAMVAVTRENREILQKGRKLFPKQFRGNRIILQDECRQEIGAVSFEENQLYFIVIPILKWNLASVRIQVLDILNRYVKIIFDLRMEAGKKQEMDLNPEIEKLLNL